MPPKKSTTEVYKSILEMLSRAGVPDDTRWCSLVFYFREMKDYSHLSDSQKARIQALLSETLEKRDYSEERLYKVLSEYQGILVESYKLKIDDLLREASAVIGNFHQLLSARYGNINDLENFTLRSVEETSDESALVEKLRGAFNGVKSLLENDIRSLETLASRDGLTNLANRRALDAFLEPAVTLWEQKRRPLAVAMFDIDHFKNFNDQHGHRIGDQVLQVVGKHISRMAAPLTANNGQALAARYGGEEFVLAVSGPGVDALPKIVGEILAAVRNFNFLIRDANGNVVENGLHITISAGIALCNPDWRGSFLENLMDSADKALYQAKKDGRDRALIFEPGPPPSFRPLPKSNGKAGAPQ